MLRALIKELLRRGKSQARAGDAITPAEPIVAGPDASALLDRGYSRLLNGDCAGARGIGSEILSHEPKHKGAHVLMAQACAAAGDGGLAEDWIGRLLALDPHHAEAYYLRGMIRDQQGKPGEAIGDYDRALKFAPSHVAAIDRKGAAHDQLGEFEQSLACARRLIELDEQNPDGHHKMGLMLRELGRLEEAEQPLRRAVALQPDLPDANCHLALVLIDHGRFAEAEPLLSRVLSMSPDHAEARWTMALLHLLQARFDAGWKYYESRETRRNASNRRYDLPEWNGRPITDGSLLIYSEQGLGDEIMFASCFGDALERAPSCVIECEPRLERIFRRSFPRATMSGSRAVRQPEWLKEITPPVVAQIATGSLPALFRNQWADFPRHGGYLVPDPARVGYWRERLRASGPGLKVGLAWTGGTLKTRRRLRSIGLAELQPLLSTEGAQFVSLQYLESEREIADLRARQGLIVHHWPEAIRDYDDTAALVQALDIVVSVCTAAVHLAGAIGKPVWVMVPAAPEWRYLSSGETVPWYPAARLFRQQRLGEWRPLIERVAGELRGVAAALRDGI